MRQECEAKLTLTSTNYETKIATLEKELEEVSWIMKRILLISSLVVNKESEFILVFPGLSLLGSGTSPGYNEHDPHLLSYSKQKENTTKITSQPFNSPPANCIYQAT